ncbi:MAG: PAS domain S-box protein [Bacteroidales bacterium]|nr:PAS domain S-box protein [Bacteroidales bacterium]
MAKKDFKQFISQYLNIVIIVLNIIFGAILAIVVRNTQINKAHEDVDDRIENSIIQIQSQLASDYSTVMVLSEIVSSQINTPRAFYDFNSLFKVILSAENSLNSVFITLSPNAVHLDESLYPLLDTLNRYNIVWKKNSNNIVFIDSLSAMENNFYFETVKNSGQLTVFNSDFNSDYVGSKFVKTVAFPIFEGTHFIGVIGFSISFDFINTILIQNELNTKTFVADEDGIILFDRGKKTTISQVFSVITNDRFPDKQVDIIRNNEFTKRKGSDLLVFRHFVATPFPVNWKLGVLLKSKDVYAKANLYFILIFILFSVFSLVVILMLKGVFSRITAFFKDFVVDIENVFQGKLQEEITVIDSFKEINSITTNLENLRKRLLKLTEIYKQIQLQDINLRLEEISSNDTLAKSINVTIDTIEERTNSRHEALVIKERTDWINEGLNIIHEAARINENSVEILTDRINSEISSYSDAFLSSFFILYEDEEKGEKYLKAVSTFGLEKNRAFHKIIKLGEGVVGSVALERKKQYFDKIPEDYHIIVAGLSEMKPISILVQPLEYEGEFYGILEIAFLKKLEEFELLFFEKASSEIALSIKNILNNISTNKLLDKMKLQTEEIEKAQELLQAKIKEISSKEKEANESEAAMAGMLNAVNNTLMTIEYTTNGILLNANKKYLDAMNFSIDELKGVNVLDLVKTERSELEDVIRRVSKGEYHEKIMKRFTKYGEVRWLHSTYTPYYDTKGDITKVLYFAFDVTEAKEQSEKLEKELRMLQKQVKLLREKL